MLGHIDWDVCLAGAPRHAHWVACAIVAARDLLDADISSAPPALLEAWGVHHHAREPISSYRTRLGALPAALWHRWPNAIEATIDLDADFDDAARIPLQLSACLRLVTRLAR